MRREVLVGTGGDDDGICGFCKRPREDCTCDWCPGCNRLVIHCNCDRDPRTAVAVKSLTPFALGELLGAQVLLGEWEQGASLADEQRKHLLITTATGTMIVDVDRQDLKGIAAICSAAVSAWR